MTTDAGRGASISAIIIVRNNERMIARCIESLHWANEIVVVDSGSSDRTPEIARSLGAQVHVMADWHGYGPQKNRALDRATCDWVLSIDSDEWIPPALQDEIVR